MTQLQELLTVTTCTDAELADFVSRLADDTLAQSYAYPAGGYGLSHSWENGATISSEEMRKVFLDIPEELKEMISYDASAEGVELKEGIVHAPFPVGQHLFVSPLDENGKLIPWDQINDELMAAFGAHLTILRRLLVADMQSKDPSKNWATILRQNDPQTATDDEVHAHIFLLPSRAYLQGCGFDVYRAIDSLVAARK